jgi:hypothetical protein
VRWLWTRAAWGAALVAASILLLEGGVRVLHGGHAPLVPIQRIDGVTRLPPNRQFTVAFPLGSGLSQGVATEYITDRGGARISDPAWGDRDPVGGVVVVGDSQALGYQLDFESTFAVVAAVEQGIPPQEVRLVAAPELCTETELALAGAYGVDRMRGQRLGIVVVNLGNDLDELFFTPEPQTEPIRNWLMPRSFLYMDWRLILRRLQSSDAGDAPGVNWILYALEPHERVTLARAAAETVREIASLMAGFEQVIAVLVPSDFQVDPAELDKYAKYATSATEFAEWRRAAPVLAAQMNAVQEFIAADLEANAVATVRFTEVVRGREQGVFDADSHHLTVDAHRWLGQAIAARARELRP